MREKAGACILRTHKYAHSQEHMRKCKPGAGCCRITAAFRFTSSALRKMKAGCKRKSVFKFRSQITGPITWWVDISRSKDYSSVDPVANF